MIVLICLICQVIALISPVRLQQFEFVSIASGIDKQLAQEYNQTGLILVNYTNASSYTPKLYVQLTINSVRTEVFGFGNFF